MKLVTFTVQTPVGPRRRLGAVLDGDVDGEARIVDLNLGCSTQALEASAGNAPVRLPADMLAFLDGGSEMLGRARDVLAYAKDNSDWRGPRGEQLVFKRRSVKLEAPLPRPRSLRDFSTYEDHGSSRGNPKPGHFYYFAGAYKGNCDSIRGPEDPMLFPAYADSLDPELELGLVIGKPGRNIPIDKAMDHVAGYTVFVDCSVRDPGPRNWLGMYKNKDFCSMIGPVLVTADEFDERDAACSIRVNGELWWEGNVGQGGRHFFSSEIVSYASEGEDLYPGDLIASGTVGTGCSIDIGRWVQPGDLVEQWIEGIGTIRSRVVTEANPPERSYVRDGLPGRLPVPEYAQGLISEVHAMMADARAERTGR